MFTPPGRSASGANELNLTLFENFIDEDMETLLNNALDAPGIVDPKPMVTVLDTQTPVQELPLFSIVSETENIFDDFAVESPIATEKIRESPTGISQVLEGSDTTINDNEESELVEDIDQAVLRYELAQDEQLVRIMAAVKPLDQIIGSKVGEICTACFHVGHYITDLDVCPTAHIRSIFSKNPFYDRLPIMEAWKLFMTDIGYACQGMTWAIKNIVNGYMQQVGIFPGTVEQLHALLKKWKLASIDENFTFGRFGALGGELTFGEPIQIPLILSAEGPYQQMFARGNSETGDDSFGRQEQRNSAAGTNIRYDRRECYADRLKLDIIGNRPTTICSNCFHRGHTKSSIKICPYQILVQAIEKTKNAKRRRKLDDFSREVERLQKVVDGIGEGENSDAEKITILLDEWKRTIDNWSIKRAKTGPILERRLQPSTMNTPDSHQVQNRADIRTHNLQSLYHHAQLESLNDNSPTYTSDFSGPSQLRYTNFSPALNSPFGEDGESILHDFPTVDNHFDYPQKFDEFDANQFINTEMQKYFDRDLDTSILTGSQSFRLNPSTSFDQSSGSLFTLQHEIQQDTTNSLEVIMSRPISPSSVTSQQDSSAYHNVIIPNPDGTPTTHELPSMIFWRSRCPLRVIGNRTDNICKSCLHYGHDKRNPACPVAVVRGSIAKSPAYKGPDVRQSIQELESAIKWQEKLPPNIRGDISLLKNLVRKWQKLEGAGNRSEIDMNTTHSKHQHPPERRTSYNPLHNQKKTESIQIDSQIQRFSPNVRRWVEGSIRRAIHLDSPHEFATLSNQHFKEHLAAKNTDTQTYQRPNLPQNPEKWPQQHQQLITPKGVAIDYVRMAPGLFARISGYIIDDNKLNPNDRLRVDYQTMPKSLIVDISKYFLDDPEQAFTQQQTMKQQHSYSSSSHLIPTGQQYQTQFKTPKRKRN